MRIPTLQLLQYAGLFTWAILGLALVLSDIIFPYEFDQGEYLLWGISHALFGITYWLLITSIGAKPTSGPAFLRQAMLIALLIISALSVTYASSSSIGGFLLLVVAGILPWCMPAREGIILVVAANVLLTAVLNQTHNFDLNKAILFCTFFLGFNSFVFVLSLVAKRQSLDRDNLRQVNSELRATQVLLADSTRIAERLRISRELHDLVGHHLTGLSLNLEVASHLVKGKALDHVNQALSVARLLLGDVREVVGSMRSGDQINISGALEELIEGVPSLRIHLDLPDDFVTTDPQRAQLILRCAQEIITNTVKHAEARNLWLSINSDEDGVNLCAYDDGRGIDDLSKGNGLNGMSERLQQIGGKLSIQSSEGKGFQVDAWLPAELRF